MCGRLKYTFAKQLRDVAKGSFMEFVDNQGVTVSGKFVDFMQVETFRKGYWTSDKAFGGKIVSCHVLPIQGFVEKDKYFSAPKGKNAVIIGKQKSGTLRLATEPATGDVKKVHHRMPFFVRPDYVPKTGGGQ